MTWHIMSTVVVAIEGFFLYLQWRDRKELRKYLGRVHDIAHETLERDKNWREDNPADGDIHSRYNASKQTLVAIRALTRKKVHE